MWTKVAAVQFSHFEWNQEFLGCLFFAEIMTISYGLAIKFKQHVKLIPKDWLNWKILAAILNEFLRQR